MALLNKIIGPESKYEKQIPYTYEGRVEIIEGEAEYYSYIADTICGLVAKLEEKGLSPDKVSIYEIFQEQEKSLNINLCLSESRQWLSREQLCQSFTEHYQGHIDAEGCTFSDRDGTCI